MPWQAGELTALPLCPISRRPVHAPPAGAWPHFSPTQVAAHCHLRDAWIVVHERVYDISSFAITHPGFNNAGQVSTALAIHRTLGTDCTQEFGEIHSVRAWRELADFQIGVLVSEEEQGDTPPVEHPIPAWLSASRDFWVNYAGGADEKVVKYCEDLKQSELKKKETIVDKRRRHRCSIA
eukprot:CAMPEP_0196580698 /NCGR_PEP_ID=MMETSP1081-20130531/30136_1 /TAXON_ID=36882 /ORGANISM="Pyramimonas amylifera, Strain CCMP720" /LENGTH=179 /DNA_ID=CAMNT_0041900649 /DNA_START=201 /DNA_END=740 /DNA_ORIENTATION=+